MIYDVNAYVNNSVISLQNSRMVFGVHFISGDVDLSVSDVHLTYLEGSTHVWRKHTRGTCVCTETRIVTGSLDETRPHGSSRWARLSPSEDGKWLRKYVSFHSASILKGPS